jgi:hypothetical protein
MSDLQDLFVDGRRVGALMAAPDGSQSPPGDSLTQTFRRRVAELLAERPLARDVGQATPEALVQVADLDYRWLALNRAAAEEFERIFGVRPTVGESMRDLLADQPAHQAAVTALWGRALAGEEFTVIEEFGDADRHRRAYEIRFNTLLDRHGRPIGAYQLGYDVTERLRAQARLRAADNALRRAQNIESMGQSTMGVAHVARHLSRDSGAERRHLVALTAVPSCPICRRPGDMERKEGGGWVCRNPPCCYQRTLEKVQNKPVVENDATPTTKILLVPRRITAGVRSTAAATGVREEGDGPPSGRPACPPPSGRSVPCSQAAAASEGTANPPQPLHS